MPSLIEELTSVDSGQLPAQETTREVAAPASSSPATGQVSEDQGSDQAQADNTASEVSDLLTEVATAEGLDLQDPNQRAFAEKLAKREQTIRDLQAQQNGSGQPEESLTEFEKQMLSAGVPKPPADQQPAVEKTAAPAGQQRPAGPPVYGDIGDQWTEWVNAPNQAEMQAYADIAKAVESGVTPDYRRLSDIKRAQFIRMADTFITPYIEQRATTLATQQFDKLFQERFGSVMPQLQETLVGNQVASAFEAAVGDLEKTKGGERIRELMKELPGQALTFKDPETGRQETYNNTRLNQILIQHPWILHIHKDHKDSATSYRLTTTARLRAALSVSGNGQVSPATAKNLMEAGQQAATKKTIDRSRQQLNAGSGGGNGRTSAGPASLVGELVAGNGPSFSDLFRKS